MMTSTDFEKKQMIFVFTLDGEKVSFSNDNISVSDSDGKLKLKTSCYRILSLNIIGHITLTSVVLQKSRKFGFPVLLMTPSFRTFDCIGHKTEGNTALRREQYTYDGITIAKNIVFNKIVNQIDTLRLQRTSGWELREGIEKLQQISESVSIFHGDFKGLMGLEGNAAKIYFELNFDNTDWKGRRPRVKQDAINATLDIGYTILFNFVDTILIQFGFDTYCGVYHREFYQRKSLTCDLMEPLRPLIDWQIRKAINLGQVKEEHFNVCNNRYLLDIRYYKDYVKFLTKPLLERKMDIYRFVRSYYRVFMKRTYDHDFPVFNIGD